MLSMLFRRWWVPFLKGVCAVLFGVAVCSWTNMPASSLALSFGVYCVADGLLSFVAARGIRTRKNTLRREFLSLGVFSVCAGGVALAWPDMSVERLLIVIALWALLRGIVEIVTARRVRKLIPHEPLLLLVGLSSLLLNLMLLMSLILEMPATPWILGIAIAIRGGLLIAMGLDLRGYRQAFGVRAFSGSYFSPSLVQRAMSSVGETEREGSEVR